MDKLVCKNPFTHEVTCEYDYDSFEAAAKKVHELTANQKEWANVPLRERKNRVQNAITYFDKFRDSIALDISESIGRPFHQAKGEINGFFERANYLCKVSEDVLTGDTLNNKPGFMRSIHHRPLGNIFVISAWNYPLLITVNSVIPSLIAGNAVLLKHSSLTPKIGEHFYKAFKKVFDDKVVLNQVVINHETTGRVIEEEKIDHVVFTGSVSGGQSILKHTSKKFMMPALELGGKDGAYVHEDASLNLAVETIVDGAMYNSGQSCCGIERAYVHESLYFDFVEHAKELIDGYKLGDPQSEETSMGPLAQAKSANEMKDQVDEAVLKGARVVSGGEIEVIGEGTFFQPTLLIDVTHDMKVMKEENFGPILPVMKVKGIDEAIDKINDSHYGLTSAIFTKNNEIAEEFAERVNVGTAFMNRCDYLDPELPWTGVKDSGCGSALSKYGFYGVTRRQARHFKVSR